MRIEPLHRAPPLRLGPVSFAPLRQAVVVSQSQKMTGIRHADAPPLRLAGSVGNACRVRATGGVVASLPFTADVAT